jgi:hypothetical protein
MDRNLGERSIAPLGTDVGFSHNAVHAILTARLPVIFYVQRDVSTAIRKSALYPKLFDLPEQPLILNGPLAPVTKTLILLKTA